jgi:hypothetical protein
MAAQRCTSIIKLTSLKNISGSTTVFLSAFEKKALTDRKDKLYQLIAAHRKLVGKFVIPSAE